jgi:hypothetical protein
MHVRLLAWVQCTRITASIASGALDEVLYLLFIASEGTVEQLCANAQPRRGSAGGECMEGLE